MPIYPGVTTNEPSVLWHGNREIQAVYRGSDQIWPSDYEPLSVTVSTSMQANEPAGVSYSITATPDPDKGRYRYDWDFGDGTTASDAEKVVSHTFGHAKYYTIAVTASNSKGSATGSLRIQTPVHPWAPVITSTTTRGAIVGDTVYYEGYITVTAGAYPVEVKILSLYEGQINGPTNIPFAFQASKGTGGGVTGSTAIATNDYGSATRNLHYFWSA